MVLLYFRKNFVPVFQELEEFIDYLRVELGSGALYYLMMESSFVIAFRYVDPASLRHMRPQQRVSLKGEVFHLPSASGDIPFRPSAHGGRG
jgi:hypothetical protein